MIQNIVQSIEQHFIDNFTYCEVNFDEPNFIGKTDEWVEILIAPILSESNGIEISCTKEHYEIHAMSYSSNNKVDSGNVVDAVISFLQNTKIDTVNVRNWRYITNGYLDNGTYFYKIIFDCDA